MSSTPTLSPLLEGFFTDRLMRQRQASRHTVAAYRDTFRLLLTFVERRIKKEPAALSLEDLDAPLVGAFLEYLENERGNTARSRNARLAAIHSFFRYAAVQEPGHAALIQRVLSMPSKRHVSKLVDFLNPPEVDALLAAPDLARWDGRRDHALLMLAVRTGLRVSEITDLRRRDVVLGVGAHVRCEGKGRKERCTPLSKEAARVLREWLRESPVDSDGPLFPNARGKVLSRDGIQYLLAKHTAAAGKKCPSLNQKHVSPHVLRHSLAMDLLHHGVDRSVIALWLGHESTETTQMYLTADVELKEKALSKMGPTPDRRTHRYRPPDRLLAFLKGL